MIITSAFTDKARVGGCFRFALEISDPLICNSKLHFGPRFVKEILINPKKELTANPIRYGVHQTADKSEPVFSVCTYTLAS
jgi:hypothetical protein